MEEIPYIIAKTTCMGAEAQIPRGRQSIRILYESLSTVRGQNLSSDALFTPKMDIFKQTILNTAYIKTLEIFLSARESLSIQTSISRSVGNQSRLHGS